MIKNLIDSFKESGTVTIALAMIFIAGVLLSAYQLFMLPHDLLLHGSVANLSLATGVFMKLSVIVMLTLLIGILTISIVIQTKKKTIVYIEKRKVNENLVQTEANVLEEKIDIDIELFKSSIDTDDEHFLQHTLNYLCGLIQAGQGAIYLATNNDGKRELELTYGFALAVADAARHRVEFGEGLLGQVAASGKSVYLDEVPEGYISIVSGLGTSFPRYLFILPLLKEQKTIGVIELATFRPVLDGTRSQLELLGNVLASKIV
jgi:hypothetical protein